MSTRVRDATSRDRDAIAAFTGDTFAWGDYVADAFDRWLADPNGKLCVAVDDGDTPVAMGRGVLLSPTEAWFQGARVHPDWRRQGIASRIDNELEAWARRSGAVVVRLCIEAWNTAAAAQVEAIGMRRVAEFSYCDRPVTLPPPRTGGNGKRRLAPSERLAPAPSAEAEPAFMAWSVGELGRRARGMFAVGWTWRRLTVHDLVAAAQAEALWMSSSGWVMAAVDEDTLEIGWLEAGPEQAHDVLAAVVQLASELGAERIEMKLPATDWLIAAAEQLRFEVASMGIYAKAL